VVISCGYEVNMFNLNKVKKIILKKFMLLFIFTFTCFLFFGYAEGLYKWYDWSESEIKPSQVIGTIDKIVELKGKMKGQQFLYVKQNISSKRFDSVLSSREIKDLINANEKVVLKYYRTATGSIWAYHIQGQISKKEYYKGRLNTALWPAYVVFIFLVLIGMVLIIGIYLIFKNEL